MSRDAVGLDLKKTLSVETSEEEDDNKPTASLEAHKTQDEPIQR